MSNINSTTNMYGNLNVNGENIKLDANKLTIKDNIITINAGEQSDKVTANLAGIEIDRGSSDKYQIIYNEEDSKLKIGLEKDLENVATEKYVNSYVKDSFLELDENGDIMLKENE